MVNAFSPLELTDAIRQSRRDRVNAIPQFVYDAINDLLVDRYYQETGDHLISGKRMFDAGDVIAAISNTPEGKEIAEIRNEALTVAGAYTILLKTGWLDFPYAYKNKRWRIDVDHVRYQFFFQPMVDVD